MECGALDVSPAMSSPCSSMLKTFLFGCIAFAVLSFMILNRPAWKLNDFDQPFYVTIAYDLDKYGVFSNGPFAPVDNTIARPPPGMFFGTGHSLFATDAPFDAEQGHGLIRDTIAAVEALEVSPQERARIFAGNARELLRLPAGHAVKARSIA